MHLGAGADEGPVTGVDDERPVRAALTLQEPPEQGEGIGSAEPRDLPLVRPPDHEVRALALPDLLPQHAPDDPGVLLVADVEATALDPHVVRRELGQDLRQVQRVGLLGRQHRERCPVVPYVEAALADLAEGDQGEAFVGEVGEPVVRGDRAEQQLHALFVMARRATAQQGERAGIVEQVEQMHGSVVLLGESSLGGTDPGNAEGRPSGGLREVLRTRSQWAAG